MNLFEGPCPSQNNCQLYMMFEILGKELTFIGDAIHPDGLLVGVCPWSIAMHSSREMSEIMSCSVVCELCEPQEGREGCNTYFDIIHPFTLLG